LSIALNPSRAFEERRLGEIFTCGVKRIRLNALKKKIETHGATIEISAGGWSRRNERLKVPSDAAAKLLVKPCVVTEFIPDAKFVGCTSVAMYLIQQEEIAHDLDVGFIEFSSPKMRCAISRRLLRRSSLGSEN
jgi:hypothetical protein